MAINTYSTLSTAVANWLSRDDLTSRITEFITLAEATLNRRVRIRAMETRVTATVSTEYVSLPTGFLEMRNFQLNTNPKQNLRYVTPEYIDTFWAGSETGQPKVYTFIGGEIQLAPAPDGSYTAEMNYYKTLDIATDLTNWILTNHPNAYLYGALLQAEPFMKNDKRIATWKIMFEDAMTDLMDADIRERWGGNAMTIRGDTTPY